MACDGCIQRTEDYTRRLKSPEVKLVLVSWLKLEGKSPSIHARHIPEFLENHKAGKIEPLDVRKDGTVVRGHGKAVLALMAGVECLPVIIKG